jgi:hypothetical protein
MLNKDRINNQLKSSILWEDEKHYLLDALDANNIPALKAWLRTPASLQDPLLSRCLALTLAAADQEEPFEDEDLLHPETYKILYPRATRLDVLGEIHVGEYLRGEVLTLGTSQQMIFSALPRSQDQALPTITQIKDIDEAIQALAENTKADDQKTYAKNQSIKEFKEFKARYQTPLTTPEEIQAFLAALPYRTTRVGYTGQPFSSVNALCAQMAWLCVDKSAPDAQKQFWMILYPEINGVMDGVGNTVWPYYGEALLDDDLAEGKAGKLINYRTLYQHADKVSNNRESEIRIIHFNPLHLTHWVKNRHARAQESSAITRVEFKNWHEFFKAFYDVLHNWSTETNGAYEKEIPFQGVLDLMAFQQVLESPQGQFYRTKVFPNKLEGWAELNNALDNLCQFHKRAAASSEIQAERCFNRNKGPVKTFLTKNEEKLKTMDFDLGFSLAFYPQLSMQGEDDLAYAENQLNCDLKSLNETALINAVINHRMLGLRLESVVKECKRRINEPSNYTFLAPLRDGTYPPKNTARELYNCLFQLDDKRLRAEFIQRYLGEEMDPGQILENNWESYHFSMITIAIDFAEGLDLTLRKKLNQHLSLALDKGALRLHSAKEITEVLCLLDVPEDMIIRLIEQSTQEKALERTEFFEIFEKFRDSPLKKRVVSALKSEIKKRIGNEWFYQYIGDVITIARNDYFKNHLSAYLNEIIVEFKDELSSLLKLESLSKHDMLHLVKNTKKEGLGVMISFLSKQADQVKFMRSDGFIIALATHVHRVYSGENIPKEILSILINEVFLLQDTESFARLVSLLHKDTHGIWLSAFVNGHAVKIANNVKDYLEYLALEDTLKPLLPPDQIKRLMDLIDESKRKPMIVSDLHLRHEYFTIRMQAFIARAFKTHGERSEVFEYFHAYYKKFEDIHSTPPVSAQEYDALFDGLDLDTSIFIVRAIKWLDTGRKNAIKVFDCFLKRIPDLAHHQEKVYQEIKANVHGFVSTTGRIDFLYHYFPEVMAGEVDDLNLPPPPTPFPEEPYLETMKDSLSALNYSNARQLSILKSHDILSACYQHEGGFRSLIDCYRDQKEWIYQDFMHSPANNKAAGFSPPIGVLRLITYFPDHMVETLKAYEHLIDDSEITLLHSSLPRPLFIKVYSHLLENLPMKISIPDESSLFFFCRCMDELPEYGIDSPLFREYVDNLAQNFKGDFRVLKHQLMNQGPISEELLGSIVNLLTPFFFDHRRPGKTEAPGPNPMHIGALLEGLPDSMMEPIFDGLKPILKNLDNDGLLSVLIQAPESFKALLYPMIKKEYRFPTFRDDVGSCSSLCEQFIKDKQFALYEKQIPYLLSFPITSSDFYLLKRGSYYHPIPQEAQALIHRAFTEKLSLTLQILELIYPALTQARKIDDDFVFFVHHPHRSAAWDLACIVNEEKRIQAVLQAVRTNRPASTKATLLFSLPETRRITEAVLEQRVREIVKNKP